LLFQGKLVKLNCPRGRKYLRYVNNENLHLSGSYPQEAG
jgi:hypothetical protein